MNKIFFAIGFLFLLSVFLVPAPTKAACTGLVCCTGKVTCDSTGNNCQNDCTWDAIKAELLEVLKFIVNKIAVPLAGVAIIIGAIIMLTSGGNPTLAGKGKTILYSAIIGLVLALCASLIINFFLTAIGAGSYTI